MTNQPSVEQFHAQFSGQGGDDDDLLPWQDPGEAGEPNGEPRETPGRQPGGWWQEPGGPPETGGSWEEPQWDEPRPAGPAAEDTRSADWLTPARLRSVTFRRAPFGKRGLDEQQVNGFLDRIEEELTLLLQEKNALAAEVGRLREYIAGTQAPTPTGTQAPTQISGTGSAPEPIRGRKPTPELVRSDNGHAPAQAEPAGVSDAPAQAVVSRVHEAHVYAASILSQAQQAADQYMQEARQYSRELIEDARRRRTELLAKAVASGAGGEAWEQEATQLRAAARHYRGALRDHFQQLLANLDEWEQSDDADPRETPLNEAPGRPD
ncbi:DivIVA domain-containing protein [Nonomuraea turcica]|uniref:DivIVA domain-containing protein n=1 Tax=Nonomuraea sp. G32 TaxID=3067274 RepID=UPI00273B0AF2|nr:DivIVA domain-containing protein [Nonomuraea sp. G32]MDP4502343.1 DivIVA domain-containing protein [Nonomuraea sp. G32]